MRKIFSFLFLFLFIFGLIFSIPFNNIVSASDYLIMTGSGTLGFSPPSTYHMARDNNGRLFIAFHDRDGSKSVKLYQSDNDGLTWSLNNTFGSSAQIGGLITINSTEKLTVFYVDITSKMSRYSGGWITTDLGAISYAIPVVDINDDIRIVYASSGKIYYMKYTDDLNTFSSPVFLGSSTENPDLCIDNNNNLYCSYITTALSKIVVKKLNYGSYIWNEILNTTCGYVGITGIRTDKNNGVHLIYQTGVNDLSYRYSSDGLTFMSLETVHNYPVPVYSPTISIDYSNNVYVVWSSLTPESGTYTQIVYRTKTVGNQFGINYTVSTGSYNHNPVSQMCSTFPLSSRINSGTIIAYINPDGTDTLHFIDTIFNSWYNENENQMINCGIDLSIYQYKGGNDYSFSTTFGYTVLEQDYEIMLDTTIKGVDLHVNPMMLTNDPDKTNYELYIGGTNIGNPVCFFNENTFSTLRWECNLNISGEGETFFYFSHTTPIIGNNIYWFPEIYTEDIDSDGLSRFYFRNWGSDGFLTIPRLYDNYDLSYKFYYETITYGENCHYTDDLLTFMDISPHLQYSPINFAYTLIDNTYVNYLNITVNDTTYPFTNIVLENCYGRSVIFPFISGIYRFKIIRNSIIVFDTNLTIIKNNEDVILSIYPDYGTQGTIVTCFYKFYHDSNTGRIIITNYGNSGTNYIIDISNNSTGNFTYVMPNYLSFPNNPVFFYFTLYSKYGSNYTNMIQKIFTLTSYSYYFVMVSYNPLIIDRTNGGTQKFIITSPDNDLDVYLNNDLIFENIGGGEFYYKIYKNGEYIVKIGYKTSCCFVEIANTTFSVNYEQEQQGDVLLIIPPPYSYFIGLFITIGMLLLPFGILKGVMDFSSFISTIISLMTGLIGLCISVLLGFFPIWVPLVVLFGTVLVIVLIWLSRKIGT